MRLKRLIALSALASGAVWAHGEPVAPGAALASYSVLMLLALAGAAYLFVWRRAPRATLGDAALFAGGCTVLAVALVGPLEQWSAASLAAHMSQHLLLMAVAAPLLVLGLPARLLLRPMSRLAPARRRRRWFRALRRLVDVRWLVVAQPVVLVFWHLPQALSAALVSETVHILMHGSFLAVALPFWTAVLRSGTREGASFGGAALLLLSTMTVMALMGAVLTLAPRTLYAEYPLVADQQLAGLIMWVPAAVPYLAAAIWLGARWLLRMGRMVPSR